MRAPHCLAPALLLLFSFLGLTIIAALISLPPGTPNDASWRKPLVGGAFTSVLVAGILAGAFPTICSGTLHFRIPAQENTVQESPKSSDETLGLRGHHPCCGNFSAHVLQVKSTLVCAGCAGLVTGAVTSIVGGVWYFFLGSSLGSYHYLVLVAGFMGVAGGLLQYHAFGWGGSSVHFLLNVFFVVGVFMLLSGVDALAQSVVIDMYVIVLSVFWLYVRILLSQLHHRRICAACGRGLCGYR